MSVIISGTDGVTFNDTSLQGAAASPYVLKNRIINGAMVINQRGSSSYTINTSASNTFSIDRFAGYGQTSDGVYTLTPSSTAPTGFNNSLLATVTTADASIGSTQLYMLRQFIEGYNIADLDWGTANAKTVTLSFQVRSSLTGTFGGTLTNDAQTRFYPFSYTISVANTWEQKSITIAGDTSGTWEKTTSRGIDLVFSFGAGSTFLGTAGSWGGTAYWGVTGQTNLIATNGATFYITGVQLEIGSTATPFERRLYNQELANCQRYCYVIPASSYYNFVAQAYSTTKAQGYLVFPVTMRSAATLTNPTLTGALIYSSNATGLAITALILVGGSSANGAYFDITVASGLIAGNATLVYSTPTVGVTVLSAEL